MKRTLMTTAAVLLCLCMLSETPVTVTRQVKLSFLAEHDWLGRVELSVREEFPLR